MTPLTPYVEANAMAYEQLQVRLRAEPVTWLVTGVAGFIGSNLLETLLKLNQRVVGLDNLATGKERNLLEVQTLVTPEQWGNFQFIRGDICNLADCQKAMSFDGASPRPCATYFASPHVQSFPVDYVLHQAALGSVPRSVADPIATKANPSGAKHPNTLNLHKNLQIVLQGLTICHDESSATAAKSDLRRWCSALWHQRHPCTDLHRTGL